VGVKVIAIGTSVRTAEILDLEIVRWLLLELVEVFEVSEPGIDRTERVLLLTPVKADI
jgi:hypothetical protein